MSEDYYDQADAEILDEASLTVPESGGESLRYIIEGILIRRALDRRLEGYTLETAQEIAAAIGQRPTGREEE